MEYAISSESMKLSDNLTIKNGVSAIKLMDRVAYALFCAINADKTDKIAIVCGSGNNGGDGYCLAIKLLNEGYNTQVYGKLPKTDTAKYYYDILIENFSNSYCDIKKMSNLFDFDIVVDCLLGIGIKGELSTEYIDYINIINTAKNIISCDIASGLHSDNGHKSLVAVKANKTLAIQSFKTGHFLADGKDMSGNLCKCDIGIEVVGDKYFIVDSEFVKNCFPQRTYNTHKGSFGRCGIIACSDNFVGSGKLALASSTAILGECAMRTGCGYSYLFVPDKMLPYMWGSVTHSCIFGQSELLNHKLDAVAFGMGVGDNAQLCEQVFDYPCPKVIDADAINFLAKHEKYLSKLSGSVLTPHPMEFSRLLNISVSEILQNPIPYAINFAKENNVVLLLKGATTIITDGVQTYLNITGNSGLAKGGSGDVLAGIIAGLMSQKISPIKATISATFLMGKTCENLTESKTEYSILPIDIANSIGDTLSKIINDKI